MERTESPSPSSSQEGNAVSNEALEASRAVAQAAENGAVDDAALKRLEEAALAEAGANGKLTQAEEKAWREWMEALVRNGAKRGNGKPKEQQLFIDEIGLSDYLSTFDRVSRQYGLGITNPKIAGIEAGFIAQGIISGLNPVRLFNWWWKSLSNRENKRLLDRGYFRQEGVLHPAAHAEAVAKQAEVTRSPFDFRSMPDEAQRWLALGRLKQWGPFLTGLATMPLAILTNKSSEWLGDEMLRMREAVNRRVADSLLMVDFEFGQQRNPAAMIGVIERGKMAIDTLVYHTYRSFIPGMAALTAAWIPLFKENPPTALLAIGRGLVQLSVGKARLTEALRENQEDMKRRGAMESRVMAILSGLELVKTDDVEKAAEELAKQLTDRDKLLAGIGKAKSDAEKARERIGKIFSYGTPIVSVGWKALMDRRRAPADQGENAPMRERLRSLIDNSPWKDERLTFVNQAYEYAIPFWNAYASQEITDKTVSSLVGLYHGTLKAAVRDIRKMEEVLGPYEALDRPDGPKEAARLPVGKLPDLSIRVEGLRYKDILRNVSLEIGQGSFVAMHGVSGEGKTTLLRHMLGLYEPKRGTVTYGGMPVGDIKKFGPESFYSRIAYAPQTPYYFPNMTLRENIKLWSRREVSDDRIRETLMDMGMGKFVGKLDDRNVFFSGGELRRLGLARALVKDPKVLILDEPTSNLDSETAKAFRDMIVRMREERPDMTVIAMTHDERFGEIADRVVHMKDINAPTQQEQVLVGQADATKIDTTAHSVV